MHPLEVDVPGAVTLAVAQRVPRDGEFRRPAALVARGARDPDGIEVHVREAAVHRLLVAQGAARIDAEHHGAPAILHAVDGDAEEVIGRVVEVAPEIAHASLVCSSVPLVGFV